MVPKTLDGYEGDADVYILPSSKDEDGFLGEIDFPENRPDAIYVVIGGSKLKYSLVDEKSLEPGEHTIDCVNCPTCNG